jgi:glycogen synthase
VRVLVLSWEYPPHVVGGLGQHVAELVPHLARLGVDVHLVSPRLKGGQRREEVATGLTVHRVDVSPAANVPDIYTKSWQVNRALEGALKTLWDEVDGFDLIHAHDWLTSFAAIARKLGHRCPLLTTMHATERGRAQGAHLQTDLQKLIHNAEWQLTFEAWRIIACSQFMADEIKRYFMVPHEKIDVIPNGVDPAPFEAAGEEITPSFRALYARPDQKIVFSVGRMVHEKGLQVLIGAAPEILAERPSTRFVVAGMGPALDWLRKMAWDIGVGENFLFPGFVSDEDRNRLFAMSACAVFPSLYEPFGIVALEAMAAGCPVIVSRVGGLAEVVEHGETGLLVPPDDAKAIADRVLQTLNDAAGTRARVEAARQTAKEIYSWSHIARDTLAVYEGIVRERTVTAW